MPLPYAPPPKESKVYRDLKNIKIPSVTVGQIDSLKTALYAQGVDGSEDEMRRLKLLTEVSGTGSSSGPLSGSQTLTTTTVVNDGTDESALTAIFTPEAGTVWELDMVGADRTGGSGSVVHNLYYTDTATGTSVRWYYYQTGDSSVIFTSDSNWKASPFIIDENFSLGYLWDGGSSITNYVLNVVCHRVR